MNFRQTERHNRLLAGICLTCTNPISGQINYPPGNVLPNGATMANPILGATQFASDKLSAYDEHSTYWQPKLGLSFTPNRHIVFHGGYTLSKAYGIELGGASAWTQDTGYNSTPDGGLHPATDFRSGTPFPNVYAVPPETATYSAGRSLKSNTSQNLRMQGGSVELGTNIWHGLGIAADVTGAHANSIGAGGVPLSLVTATFGPRYRWRADQRIAIYGEGLIGEANGFLSLFPTKAGQQSEANSLASQVGGGIDYRLSDRFAIRMLDAAWSRTQLPNSTDNVQNTLRLSAGIVLRFARQ